MAANTLHESNGYEHIHTILEPRLDDLIEHPSLPLVHRVDILIDQLLLAHHMEDAQ